MSNVVISGANRGIGLELCRQLSQRGERVIALCRNPSEELSALDLEVIAGVDVCNNESIADLRQRLGEVSIDCLINNAGLLQRESLDNLDFETMEQQFRVNALGPIRLTTALRGQLADGAKVAIITSRMGSIDDNTSGGYYGYRMSKAAVNMAGRSLAHDLRDRGIAVALLHPGMVATEMTGGNGIPVARAAANLIQRLDEMNLDNSGSFWHAEGYKLPW